MTTAAPTTTSAAFLARVAAALEDLTPAEREDLLVDVRGTVAELVATGEPPEDRLGRPELFAAELRTAAGFPPAAAETGTGPERQSRWWRWWPLSGFLIGYAVCVPGVGDGVAGVLVPRINGHAWLAVLAIVVSTALATAVGMAATRWRYLLPVAVAGSVTLLAVAAAHISDAVRLVR